MWYKLFSKNNLLRGCLGTLTFLLAFILSFYAAGQDSGEIKKMLGEVKDASYFDSTLLFKRGGELLSLNSDYVVKAEVHLYYGNYFYYTQRIEKAKSYFELSLKEAVQGRSKHFEILAQIRLAYIDYESGQHFSAENKINELLAVCRMEKDYENVAEAINFLAIIKEGASNTKEAAELYYEGLLVSEEHNLEYYKAVFKNNLGLIKLYSGQVENAEKDFREGLYIAEKGRNLRMANHLKMNLCLTFVQQNKPDSAYKLFFEVIDYSKRNNLPVEMGSNYINLGSALLNAGFPDTALAYFDSAITSVRKYNLYSTMIRGYFGKVETYLKKNNVRLAEENILIADTLIKRIDNLVIKAALFNLKYQFELIKGNYKNALENYISYTMLSDSINKDFNTKTIEELQYNYRVQQKEAELEKERSKSALLEIRNQKEKFLKWVIAGASLLIIIIFSAFFYNRYLRKLKEKQAVFSKMLIENIEEERKRISMDLHDDIGQNLSIIKAKVIKSGIESSIIENDISNLIEQTRELSRNLYPTNIEKIGITRAVASIMENLQSVKGLECSYEFCDSVVKLPLKVQTNIYRIIQECINNTIKHSGASGLKITINDINGVFTMVYLDNGSGIRSKKNNEGIGLLSIQERAKIINGSIDIDEKSVTGFRLILKFKTTKEI